ncbi:Sialidase [Lasiosphaeria ovina]|uniref:Sialidase n=1 Tax=Lasiosphaeria ovina TaxID=92902 RepID=A0AAE0K2D5_9PEZI|nr:Sialidase [Lasiosphaeria ovina]
MAFPLVGTGPGIFLPISGVQPEYRATFPYDNFTHWNETALDEDRERPFMVAYKFPSISDLSAPEYVEIPLTHPSLPEGRPISKFTHVEAMAGPHIETWRSGNGLITIGSDPGSDYPRAIATRDGTLLATYRWGDDTTTKIVTKKSKDGGATWSDPVEVMSWDATKGDLKNPFLLQTSSGAILCASLLRLTYDLTKDKEKPWHMELNVHQSKDSGQSWSKLGNILSSAPGHGIQGEWEPFLREAPDGTLQAYYSHELSPSDQDIVFRTSRDGGETWSSDFVTVAGAGNPATRPGMPQVLDLDGGGANLLMVYENNADDKKFRVWAQTSADGGNTWAHSRIIFEPGQGNAGGPGLAQIPGRLVVSFMTNQDQPHRPYPQEADMKIITSSDGGATWSEPIKAIEQAGWGGVTAVDGGVAVLGATPKGTAVMQVVAF